MKFQHGRWFIVVLFTLMMPTWAYLGSIPAQAATAQPLIADSWNGAFGSDNTNAINGISRYSDNASGLTAFHYPNITLSGFPNPNIPIVTPIVIPILTPPPSNGPIGVTNLVVPDGSATPAPTAAPVEPLTGFSVLPIALTGNPVSNCRPGQAITEVGFPYGPVTVTWSAVKHATSYDVAIGAIPQGKKYYVLMATTTVAAPTLQATLVLNHADVANILNAKLPFVILVKPNGDTGQSCLSTLQFITAAVRKTPQPTATAVPTEPANNPSSGGQSGPSAPNPAPTSAPVLAPPPSSGGCPAGTRMDANGACV
jgi:hypothetical protein